MFILWQSNSYTQLLALNNWTSNFEYSSTHLARWWKYHYDRSTTKITCDQFICRFGQRKKHWDRPKYWRLSWVRRSSYYLTKNTHTLPWYLKDDNYFSSKPLVTFMSSCDKSTKWRIIRTIWLRINQYRCTRKSVLLFNYIQNVLVTSRSSIPNWSS